MIGSVGERLDEPGDEAEVLRDGRRHCHEVVADRARLVAAQAGLGVEAQAGELEDVASVREDVVGERECEAGALFLRHLEDFERERRGAEALPRRLRIAGGAGDQDEPAFCRAVEQIGIRQRGADDRGLLVVVFAGPLRPDDVADRVEREGNFRVALGRLQKEEKGVPMRRIDAGCHVVAPCGKIFAPNRLFVNELLYCRHAPNHRVLLLSAHQMPELGVF